MSCAQVTGSDGYSACTPPGAGAANGRANSRKTYIRAKLDGSRDVSRELAKLYRAARSGYIDVADASRLANVLSILARVLGDSQLEARIEALEQKGARQ